MLNIEIEKQLGRFSLKTGWQHPGGCLGILGRSGCGKSLTLKCIAGLAQPDRGRIESDRGLLFERIGKKATVNVRPQERKIGYLFQQYALFPGMTAAENVAVGLQYGQASERTVKELLATFHISELADHYPDQLSGGQQQRVALARMIAGQPDILLLDEPFAALDGHLREVLRFELLSQLSEYGRDMVLVSHDRDDIYYMCRHTLLMERGEVLEYGETKELFRNIRYTESASLTGCKNVACIQRVDEHSIYVPQWRLRLKCDREVEQRITDVGLRAHALQPVTAAEAAEIDSNLVSTEGARVTELPFGWQVVTREGIWWKREKLGGEGFCLPPFLRILPTDLLLLEKKYETKD
ncbi:MAG: ATP-binding cassette domain-containing protein [Lachnospiraceae bacterium]|nr:ATP-binding cassette domain-containing protein [Lachnospiraceae bacterium]MDY5741768.1 ATP-binding cassette domain-containing protein [Lachnospiraceae bacterium]